MERTRPLGEEPTNHDRADWAEIACKAFAAETGQRWAVEQDEIIGDLLCDLLHLAARHDISVSQLIANARATYREEKREESRR